MMNCHDVFPWLETGGSVRRWQAARHMRRCPKCRAAVEALATWKSELAAAPPLSVELRQRWLDAADEAVEVVRAGPSSDRRIVWFSIAVAACLVVAVGIAALMLRSGKPVERPNPSLITRDD